MRVRLITGGDLTRYGLGICEPGEIVNIPEPDASQLLEYGHVERLPALSALPIRISVNFEVTSNGNI